MREKILKIGFVLSVFAAGLVIGGLASSRYQTDIANDGLIVRTNGLTGNVIACDHQQCWNVVSDGTAVLDKIPF